MGMIGVLPPAVVVNVMAGGMTGPLVVLIPMGCILLVPLAGKKAFSWTMFPANNRLPLR